MSQSGELFQLGFTARKTDKDDRLSFVAAAVTVGFELCENTPKVSNVYDTEHAYEPGEPGDVRMYMPLVAHGININEFLEVWARPDAALNDSEGLPVRIRSAKTSQELVHLTTTFQSCYLSSVVAHMRLYSLNRIRLPDVLHANNEEVHALEVLDTFERDLETMATAAERNKMTAALVRHWRPALVGWLKAFKANRLELSNLWQTVPEAIRIKRGNGLPPLVLEKGPQFKELIERWT